MTDARRREQGSIEDARGRVVSQLDPVMMHLMRRHDVIPADSLAIIARGVGIGLTRANRLLLWASALGCVCLVIAVTIVGVRLSNGTMGGRRAAQSLVPFGAIIVCFHGSWMATKRARTSRITEAMLGCRRCPHCGYDLSDLPAEDDDATVCPECGSAWRLDGG
jgi:hypothetical protein